MKFHSPIQCLAAITFATAVQLSPARADETPRYNDPKAPVEERTTDLLSKMTLEEKIDMIAGISPCWTVPNKRLGIPSIVMADGRMGIRDWHTSSTCYPAGIALSASWDRDLAAEFGRSMARDAHARGVNIWLGPMVNMYRIPVGGRNFECAGEDPYLVAQMAVAEVNALQANGVMATAVIFCCNDQDFGHQKGLTRHTANSIVDERTLREIYFPPFQALVQDAHVGAVMASYNLLNGEHCTQNSRLLIDILKGEWGFSGFVMSDWDATHDTLGAANGGLDLEMPEGKYFNRKLLLPAVQKGLVKQEMIDDKVRRILRVFFSRGFFDKPQHDTSIPMDDPKSVALALKMAREEMVLLKNENRTLPLDRKKIHSVAVLGPNAVRTPHSGSGSSYCQIYRATDVLAGIRQVGGESVKVASVPWPVDFWAKPESMNPGAPPCDPKELDDLIARSVKTAREADAAVVCVGFRPTREEVSTPNANYDWNEGEGADRHYALPPGQDRLVREIVAANPRTVVILNAGGGVDWSDWLDKTPALIHAWYPGQEGGRALAEIIFGDVNPSAKLPASFEKRWEDNPSSRFYDSLADNKVVYGEGIFMGYRGFDQNKIEPQFQFGFGLSYTTFSYGNLKIDQVGDNQNPKVTVHFDIKNTGQRAGAEIAQVYVGESQPIVPRPPKELKGFQRVQLAPGETKTVSVELDRSAFSYYDPQAKTWKIQPGEFKILAGASSRAILLERVVKL